MLGSITQSGDYPVVNDAPRKKHDLAAAGLAKDRLRADLKIAMRNRAGIQIRALRTLVAALDSAEAVPAHDRHELYVVHTFGDGSAKVPRINLTHQEVIGVLQREAAARRADAVVLFALGKVAQAKELHLEADLIDSYSQISD